MLAMPHSLLSRGAPGLHLHTPLPWAVNEFGAGGVLALTLFRRVAWSSRRVTMLVPPPRVRPASTLTRPSCCIRGWQD